MTGESKPPRANHRGMTYNEGVFGKGKGLAARFPEPLNVNRHVEARRADVFSGISNR
jgi:hypothetical protein